MIKLALRILAAGTVLLASNQAMAQTTRTSAPVNFKVMLTLTDGCEIFDAPDINFGAHSSFPEDVLKQSVLKVECTTGTDVVVKLDGGQSGNVAGRSMTNGTAQVKYQLYSDPAHTKVWGNTETDSVKISGVAGAKTSSQTIYAVLFSKDQQEAVLPAGSYVDTITASLEY